MCKDSNIFLNFKRNSKQNAEILNSYTLGNAEILNKKFQANAEILMHKYILEACVRSNILRWKFKIMYEN